MACPMVLAARGTFPLGLIIWCTIGGALVTASANVINCIWDRDIDSVMRRTKDRPMPTQRVSPLAASLLASFLGALGFFILLEFANPLAAMTALFGHLFYVVIYTVWLKRTSTQNIVIGGAAGAMPPVVGWAAVTGEISMVACLMFLVIFLWTPPHFWALALNKNEDYTKANVPMLPVVKGERHTHWQMLIYAISLLPVSVWLVSATDNLGVFSLTVLTGLGAIFIWRIVKLMRTDPKDTDLKEKRAWSVFGFSLLYLSLFFVCLVVDALFFRFVI